MHPLRRPTKSTIYYLGREHSQDGYGLVTLSINGVRWNYILTCQQCDTVEHLAHKVSIGRALAFAKSHARHSLRLDPLPSTTLFQRHRGAQASRAKRLKVSLADV